MGSLFSCQEKKQGVDAEYYNILLAVLNGGYYSFSGTLSETTSSCGSATAATSSSTSTTTTTTATTSYKITAYFEFLEGQSEYTFNYPLGSAQMYLKFVYDTTKRKFSLSPSTTSTTTCYTTDYVHCNGTSANPSCVTIDGTYCGGENTFSFSSTNNSNISGSEIVAPNITFLAKSGEIDYRRGVVLDTNKTTVTRMDIDFNMTSEDGVVFKGSLYCKYKY